MIRSAGAFFSEQLNSVKQRNKMNTIAAPD
jgi:hypothetical protein